MPHHTASRILLGPFQDLRRLVVGFRRPPPSTRRTDAGDLAHAQATLTAAGCDLAACTVTNLHKDVVALPAPQVYDLFWRWQPWPLSAFFAVATAGPVGDAWLAYRFYKVIAIVRMRLKTAVEGSHIIYRIESGIGAGGYHAFLFQALSGTETAASIFTTFPPSHAFFEGLHDQMNFDIYRQLQALAADQAGK